MYSGALWTLTVSLVVSSITSKPCVQDLQHVVVYIVVHAGDCVKDLSNGEAFRSYVQSSLAL